MKLPKRKLFGKPKIEFEHRGIQIEGQPKFYWAMLFQPGNTQPHMRIPPKTVFRCVGSSSAIEFLNETTNGTQPMMEAWEGNHRHDGIVPDLILMTPDEAVFRFVLEATEDDFRKREFVIKDCPSSWGHGWTCVERQRT